MLLSLLISGPRQPSNDIDVYLAPLLEDLKLLWEVGIEAFDAYQQELFTLKVVLLWTISDFPAYENLSGCTIKGYFACPICGEETDSQRLKHGKKNSFTGHRRFLPCNHPFRKQKKAFNGEQDFRSLPQPLSGEEILHKMDNICNSWVISTQIVQFQALFIAGLCAFCVLIDFNNLIDALRSRLCH